MSKKPQHQQPTIHPHLNIFQIIIKVYLTKLVKHWENRVQMKSQLIFILFCDRYFRKQHVKHSCVRKRNQY